jgi:hypothetical protein
VNEKRPVWLLDVDGVINMIGSKQSRWPGPMRRADVCGYPIRWSPALVDAVNTVHRSGMCEVRWATTWIEGGAVDRLAETLGFDYFETAYTRFPHEVHDEAKMRAAVRVLAVGRRLVWTDDEVVPLTAADRVALLGPDDGRWLTIRPGQSRGLGPKDLAVVASFLGDGSACHALIDAANEWVA